MKAHDNGRSSGAGRRYERLHDLFARARLLPPPQRSGFLRVECGQDVELLRELQEMLEFDGSATNFLEPELLEGALEFLRARGAGEASALIGREVGGCHLRRVIARGGMGTVYEGEQRSPRRSVAVKVMRRGLGGAGALRRFEFESQVLAHLRHPGIAQVYEAGCFVDGDDQHPFFVMELVPGARPITRYAREKRLSSEQRFELFAKVCKAVHHGHQRGIVHRDLKPDNILVDSAGDPKVIDFGVARSTGTDLTAATLQTDIGQLVGTLQYMSPEQCGSESHDLDVRSDVYSLGMVLFELLCEQLPYSVRDAVIQDAIATVQDATPLRPSTLDRRLKGDAETIVLKALEKDRERRYQSALDLAQDIGRYLSGDAILARRPSALYQLRKLARRHRATAAALVGIIVALALGLVGTTWKAAQARQAEHAALELAAGEAAQRRAAEAARQEAVEAQRAAAQSARQALVEAEKARAAVGLLVGAIEVVDPDGSLSREPGWRATTDGLGLSQLERRPDLTLREFVDGVRDELEAGPPRDPEVEATVRSTLGVVLRGLGLTEESATQHSAALELRREALGEVHPAVVESSRNLAWVMHDRQENTAGLEMIEHALEVQRRVAPDDAVAEARLLLDRGQFLSFAGEHERALTSAAAASALATGLSETDASGVWFRRAVLEVNARQLDAAQSSAENALRLAQRAVPEDPRLAVSPLRILSLIADRQGRLEEAVLRSGEALELIRSLPSGRAHLLGLWPILEDHAALLARPRVGRYAEAVDLAREALAAAIQTYGGRHPHVARCMLGLYNRLAESAGPREGGRARHLPDEVLREQEALLRGALDLFVAFGDGPGRLFAADRLGWLIHRRSPAEAIELVQQALAQVPADAATILPRRSLHMWLGGARRHAEEEAVMLETLEICLADLGPDHPETHGSLFNLRKRAQDTGRWAACLRAHERVATAPGASPRQVDRCARLLLFAPGSSEDDHARAAELAHDAVRAEPQSAPHWNTYGTALCKLGRFSESIAAIEESMRLGEPDASDWLVLSIDHSGLGDPSQAWDLLERGDQWIERTGRSDPELLALRAEAQQALLAGER